MFISFVVYDFLLGFQQWLHEYKNKIHKRLLISIWFITVIVAALPLKKTSIFSALNQQKLNKKVWMNCGAHRFAAQTRQELRDI